MIFLVRDRAGDGSRICCELNACGRWFKDFERRIYFQWYP
jgi:hypothetical protein